MNYAGLMRHRNATHRWDQSALASVGDAVDEFSREFNYAQNTDFAMARTSRWNRRPFGVNLQGTNADFHLRNDIDMMLMIESAREMDRNDPYVGQALSRLVGLVLQRGITLDPQTGETAVDEMLKARWDEWAGNPDLCDVAGELNLHAMARMGMRQTLVDGDTIYLPLRDGRIQTVEAHRLRTPKDAQKSDRIVNGVQLEAGTRRRLRYWLAKADLDPWAAVDRNGFTSHAVREPNGLRVLVHLYTSKRLSATRGHTVFAPIEYIISSLNRLNYAKLIQSQVAAMFGFIRETPVASLNPKENEEQFGAQRKDVLPDGTLQDVQEVQTGLTYQTAPGERVVPWNSNIPEAGYFDHAALLLTIIAINLGLPLHALLMDPTKTNFSGWRGAMSLAQVGFRRLQQWMQEEFYGPIWKWKVAQWTNDPEVRSAAVLVARGGGSIFRVGFGKPGWASIEPFKDAMAAEKRMQTGQTSPRRILAETGLDWPDVVKERVDDYGLQIETAMKRRQQTREMFPDEEVDWREFLGQQPKLLPAGPKRPGQMVAAPPQRAVA